MNGRPRVLSHMHFIQISSKLAVCRPTSTWEQLALISIDITIARKMLHTRNRERFFLRLRQGIFQIAVNTESILCTVLLSMMMKLAMEKGKMKKKTKHDISYHRRHHCHHQKGTMTTMRRDMTFRNVVHIFGCMTLCRIAVNCGTERRQDTIKLSTRVHKHVHI